MTTGQSEIARDWAGVQKWLANTVRLGAAVSAPGGAAPLNLFNHVHSLILVHAYGVLQQALADFRDAGQFSSSSRLKDLMDSSHAAGIPWQKFDRVNEGREKRNRIAHDAATLPRNERKALIGEIDAQLRSWQLIT